MKEKKKNEKETYVKWTKRTGMNEIKDRKWKRRMKKKPIKSEENTRKRLNL